MLRINSTVIDIIQPLQRHHLEPFVPPLFEIEIS